MREGEEGVEDDVVGGEAGGLDDEEEAGEEG